MLTTLGIVLLGLLALIVLLVAVSYLAPPSFRFWLLDIWADLPLIGTVARLSRMFHPTTETANKRLDKLFNSYHNHIQDPLPKEDYDRLRKYLLLAGDSDSRPTPTFLWMLLILLMAAEAFTFSFLLGVSLSQDITEKQANIVAIVLALVLAVLFGGLSHPAGHAIRRTKELRAACRDAIDDDTKLGAGEKPLNMLTELIGLDEPQDRDQPRKHNFDSQRLLNRVRRTAQDNGSYFVPVLFVAFVIAAGALQFSLRSGTSFVSDLLELEANSPQVGQNTPAAANTFFVLIFLLTQGLALYLGYAYGFLGKDSARAYRIIGGVDDHRNYQDQFNSRVKRADESLSSLLSRYKRYKKISPEHLNYMERVERRSRASASSGGGGGGLPGSPPTKPSNPKAPDGDVIPFSASRKGPAE